MWRAWLQTSRLPGAPTDVVTMRLAVTSLRVSTSSQIPPKMSVCRRVPTRSPTRASSRVTRNVPSGMVMLSREVACPSQVPT